MDKEDKKRLMTIRHSMYCRCFYSGTHGYNRYGGRGIKMCDEWIKNPQSFYDWSINNGYRKDLTLDRIDVNGNYEPSNCRWVTREVQDNNRRTSRKITYNGETKTVSQWARKYKINLTTLCDRLKAGLTIDEALNKPVYKSGGYLFYTYKGKTKMLSDWCKEYNINYQNAWRKLKRGLTIEQVLNK